MFSAGQVSEMTGIPSSTLRRYVANFGDHLSDSATRKRGRHFTELDIATLVRAREIIQQGKTPNETSALLAVVQDDVEPSTALALIPSIGTAIAELVDVASGLRGDMDDLQERLDAIEAWAEQRRRWEALPWWRRIFNSAMSAPR